MEPVALRRGAQECPPQGRDRDGPAWHESRTSCTLARANTGRWPHKWGQDGLAAAEVTQSSALGSFRFALRFMGQDQRFLLHVTLRLEQTVRTPGVPRL